MAFVGFSAFLPTWLDNDLGHREQQGQRHTLKFVVIPHGPCAD